MGWTLIKQIDEEGIEKEYLQEVTVRTPDPITIQKLWTKEETEAEIQKIDVYILDAQERKAIILEQMEKFKPVEAVPK